MMESSETGAEEGTVGETRKDMEYCIRSRELLNYGSIRESTLVMFILHRN